MEFKAARLDTPALIITSLVTALLVGLTILFFALTPIGLIFSLVSALIISLSYLLSPANYSIEGANLIIRKVIGKEIRIHLNEIDGYAVIKDFSKLRVARTFGNGGLFGYYGAFSTAEYGPINFQLRSLKNFFIIKTKDNAYAISPAAVMRFEEMLTSAVQGMKGKIDILAPAKPETMKYANPLILLLPALLFILTVVMVLLVYSQLPERIAVHFDLQGNPDGWGSRTSYLISGIVPAAILTAISIIAFLIVRRATKKPNLPYYLITIFVVIQFFIAYVSFETYWVNKQGTHIIPFPYGFIIYFIAIVALLFVYYRKVKTSA